MRADLQDRGRRRADKNRQIGTDRRGVPAYHPDVPRAFPYHRGIGRCIARIPLHVSSSHPRILTSRQESKGFAMSARSFVSFVLMLLLAALRFGVVKLEQVRTAALFLTGIFPLLFVPAAAGVMDLWADLQAMLVPVLLALIPITILVMTVSGCVTQRLAERKEKKQ